MSIDYQNELNQAQYEAVTTTDRPLLVIAGAGSGKTRTIVYRLAYLVEQGVPPEAILLLTFTRKAAQEMLLRAGDLLRNSQDNIGGFGSYGSDLVGAVQGGTFHSFAYKILRTNPPPDYPDRLVIMDRQDAEHILRDIKAELKIGKGDRSFPKIGTVYEMLSKSRNKELTLDTILTREAFHLATYGDDFREMGKVYAKRKRENGLLDYDDLLFGLESLLKENEGVREWLRGRFGHIMIDEYQDTNLVQARLVQLLAPVTNTVMAVGDDAQSIYAFRGANVRNILDFPKNFPDTKLVKLEQNYRSTQPILDLTNKILEQATAHFDKHLFSDRTTGPKPELLRPLSDLTQSRLVVNKIVELLKKYPASEIAVLFRAGYQSYNVETNLAKLGVAFKKYGGLRFSEASHVKDVLSFLRLALNPGDTLAWQRAISHINGIGPKTALRLHNDLLANDEKKLQKSFAKWPELRDFLELLEDLRKDQRTPAALAAMALEFYEPILEMRYPDDYPRRQKGLEELAQIALGYEDLEQFLADLSLENPERGEERTEVLTLSTIHQAKGLEWDAVLLIDAVEERFPSRHALNNPDDLEEERRLMYVACTRAREYLGIFAPKNLYRRGQDFSEPASLSPFVREIENTYLDEYREELTGGMHYKRQGNPAILSAADAAPESPDGPPPLSSSKKAASRTDVCCYCKHKIFGRGKIIGALPPDKYRVNFPGFGLKVILADYLELEKD